MAEEGSMREHESVSDDRGPVWVVGEGMELLAWGLLVALLCPGAMTATFTKPSTWVLSIR